MRKEIDAPPYEPFLLLFAETRDGSINDAESIGGSGQETITAFD